MNVYLLQHVHLLEDGAEDVKIVGLYSSRESAEAAITRLSRVAGFSDAPAGFHVDEYVLDHDQWVEGYSTLANT